MDLLKIPFDLLPKVVAPWAVIGYLSKSEAEKMNLIEGIPLVAGAGYLLTLGNKEDIKREVIKTIKILGENGGYVLSSTHNIQPDVPLENILEMYKIAKTLEI